jgi:hypothetical protein
MGTRLGAAAFLLGLVAGCTSEIVQRRETGEVLWAKRRPTQFVLVECKTGITVGCTRTAVDGNNVIRQEFHLRPDGERSVTWKPRAKLESVDPVTRAFEEARTTSCDVKELAIDDTYGYVREIYLECARLEGRGNKVTCFAPDTLDFAACESQ